MPYNTTAIPPRKEVTGQTQLPLTRVKKIIAMDPDINVCSNNAAFVITLATEMFIQHLASEAQNMAKLERKPRRNIQYKDVATAVMHHDNLEFLEDVVPKTSTFKQVKSEAAATRAKLKGEKSADGTSTSTDPAAAAAAGIIIDDQDRPLSTRMPNGKKQKSIINGSSGQTNGFSRARVLSSASEDPNAQLELEMRQAQRSQGTTNGGEDVDMTG
ncbi:histone-fold-containing protein [Podospora appendiculata]|uniref:Histone-fold-containing protein n=1 Tax=Podospora appendiculata TaxID=314037 RepID=A0AAE0X9P2_9PEZI|nr:histone-fold-containing protein [Podospora appendiculata]